MNKVKLNVVKEVKVDGRNNNTGRPVNKKSSRQIRLAKQALYSKLNKQFVSGKEFKINNDGQSYVYSVSDNGYGHISNGHSYVCNVDYIGRTKVQGFTFILGKHLKFTINLKEVEFVK